MAGASGSERPTVWNWRLMAGRQPKESACGTESMAGGAVPGSQSLWRRCGRWTGLSSRCLTTTTRWTRCEVSEAWPGGGGTLAAAAMEEGSATPTRTLMPSLAQAEEEDLGVTRNVAKIRLANSTRLDTVVVGRSASRMGWVGVKTARQCREEGWGGVKLGRSFLRPVARLPAARRL